MNAEIDFEPNKSPKSPVIFKKDNGCKVKVAVRIRPFNSKELLQNSKPYLLANKNTNQILFEESTRNFQFDHVFDQDAEQKDIFEFCAEDLVIGCFEGYNATILAYGQTSSGKTYTMGTSSANLDSNECAGIIPRVMEMIFNEIEKRKNKVEFIVKASFLEIYNEECRDLLDRNQTYINKKKDNKQKEAIYIREEKNGQINVYGLVEEKAENVEQIIQCLERGSLQRSTSSTLMNDQSSRSHAIFTISIESHRIDDLKENSNNSNKKKESCDIDDGFTTAKFHFVDLAGSERLKKTGAVGQVLKEGININLGLLVLGNVITKLTEENKQGHIPYRESKLTRILQDSLGGNSRTVMIACVSPCMSNYDETLNTLQYAGRARNIKNKPIVNRDPTVVKIMQLQSQVVELEKKLQKLKQVCIQHGISLTGIFVIYYYYYLKYEKKGRQE